MLKFFLPFLIALFLIFAPQYVAADVSTAQSTPKPTYEQTTRWMMENGSGEAEMVGVDTIGSEEPYVSYGVNESTNYWLLEFPQKCTMNEIFKSTSFFYFVNDKNPVKPATMVYEVNYQLQKGKQVSENRSGKYQMGKTPDDNKTVTFQWIDERRAGTFNSWSDKSEETQEARQRLAETPELGEVFVRFRDDSTESLVLRKFVDNNISHFLIILNDNKGIEKQIEWYPDQHQSVEDDSISRVLAEQFKTSGEIATTVALKDINLDSVSVSNLKAWNYAPYFFDQNMALRYAKALKYLAAMCGATGNTEPF